MLAITIAVAIGFVGVPLPGVSSSSADCAQEPISLQSVTELIQGRDVALIGEEHGDGRHAARLVDVLRALEQARPGWVGALGLEVFSKYQPAINGFLAEGNEDALLSTPDEEALRGQRGPETRSRFLAIYKAVRQINRQRASGHELRVIALDKAPDPKLTWTAWRKSVSTQTFMDWAFSRDEHMFAVAEPVIRRGVAEGRLTIIYLGAAHAQRGGSVHIKVGEAPRVLRYLGVRIAEHFPKVLAVTQNDPRNDCVDKVEAELARRGLCAALVDLRVDALGRVANFRCRDEIPVPYAFAPADYQARDHYDLYWYHGAGAP